MKNIYIVSLGCVKNLVDTEIASGTFISSGYGITPLEENADIYFINTCSFIQSARAEAEDFIQEALEWKKNKPSGKVVIAGCLVNWDINKQIYSDKYPEVDAWIHSDQITEIAKIFNSLYDNEKEEKVKTRPQSSPSYLYNEKTPRLQLTMPHIAYLKISDGCNNNCSYCTIPFIRGSLRSRTISSVVIEAQNLIKNGVKELILIAQDLADFNFNKKDENLSALLQKLDKIKGDFKIRLLYIHPAHLTEETVQIIADSKHILHYMDLPLQHISNPVLKAMNRKISYNETINKLKMIKSIIPDIAIRTTFIVGFPGETENDFKLLKEFLQKQKFTRVGFFTYFPEQDTPAIAMKNQIPHEIASKRLEELQEIQQEISLQHNQSLIGKTLKVIIDFIDPEKNAYGRTYMDAPEVDNIVFIKQDANLTSGEIYDIKIIDASYDSLEGKLIDN